MTIAHSISAIDNILVDLGRQDIDDGLGITVGSEEELVFRIVRLILNTGFSDLDRTIHGILAMEFLPSDKPDILRSFLAALPVGKAELWRITRIWLSYRRGEPTIRDPSHAAAYRLALRRAFDELAKMDEIPELEQLLYRWIASVRSPDIVRACEQMLVAIHVRVDIDAARRIWQTRSRWTRAVVSNER